MKAAITTACRFVMYRAAMGRVAIGRAAMGRVAMRRAGLVGFALCPHRTSRVGATSALTAMVALALLVASAPALAQMPDLRQMSGQPLPSGDLPAGTVSVRVVREAVTNNLPDIEVRLEGGPRPLTARTDASGRATFPKVAAGLTLQASATVEGEKLQSQQFVMPSTGGVRMLLAAGLGLGTGGASAGAPSGGQAGRSAAPGQAGAGAPSAAQAMPGEVTLGGQSRVIIELVEDAVEVYGLFELANLTATPVMPARPIVFEMPAAARNTSVLEGSSPLAAADGNRIVINGPFPPGNTSVQTAYRHPVEGGRLDLSQILPLKMAQTTVIIRKIGGLTARLPGETGQREVPLQGRTYLVLNGGAVEAGAPLAVTLSGLPHAAAWPRNLALGLALAIVIGGVALAFGGASGGPDADEIKALRARRKSLFEKLVALERRRVAGAQDDPELQARRDSLMADLEAIDDDLAAAAPAGARVEAAPAAQPSERLGARPVAR